MDHPRWSSLLTRLQSLDHLMNRIDWRERFVGLCLKDHTRDQRNRVLSWCGAGLGGLRWEAISGFCKTVPHLNNSTSTFIFTIIFLLIDTWYQLLLLLLPPDSWNICFPFCTVGSPIGKATASVLEFVNLPTWQCGPIQTHTSCRWWFQSALGTTEFSDDLRFWLGFDSADFFAFATSWADWFLVWGLSLPFTLSFEPFRFLQCTFHWWWIWDCEHSFDWWNYPTIPKTSQTTQPSWNEGTQRRTTMQFQVLSRARAGRRTRLGNATWVGSFTQDSSHWSYIKDREQRAPGWTDFLLVFCIFKTVWLLRWDWFDGICNM